MTSRTSKRTVTFGRPFILKVFDDGHMAGDYSMKTEEASLETMSVLARRRVSNLLYLRAKCGRAAVTRRSVIDPNELDVPQKRDRTRAGSPAVGDDRKKPATERLQASTDRLAVERGENEGMIVHPA